jgi:hypothetical protein
MLIAAFVVKQRAVLDNILNGRGGDTRTGIGLSGNLQNVQGRARVPIGDQRDLWQDL